MKRPLTRILLILAAFSATACASSPAPTARPATQESPVWMSKALSGGRQCEDEGKAPKPFADLSGLPVSPLECRIEQLPVCQACGICPAWAFKQLVRASSEDSRILRKNGYHPEPVENLELIPSSSPVPCPYQSVH